MKILFLTDTWFPRMTANAICVKNISEELIVQKNEVYVCAYGDRRCPKEEDGIKFSYIRPSFSRLFLNMGKYKNTTSAKVYKILGKILNSIRRIMLLPFYPIVTFVVPYRWLKAYKNVKSAVDIQKVVSVVAPDESLFSGYLIKKNFPNTKWIVYYIDAGTNVLKGTTFEHFKRTLQKKAIRWENKILEKADKIIVMEGHSEYYRRTLSSTNIGKLVVADVPLLKISQKNGNAEALNFHNTERWVYTGNMNGKYYHPKKLCDVFIEYCNIRQAELHLYGPSDCLDFLYSIQKNHRNIIWHGMKSHEEVIEAQSNADVLVYFKCENLDSISGKLFEYIAHGKPIIFIGPSDDINSFQLSKYSKGLALSINKDAKENAVEIKNFLTRIAKEPKIQREVIESVYSLCLPKTTANIITQT